MSQCPIPVISAVGHEVDWTLSDHVADVRCETPTAAAEVLTQPQTEVVRRIREAHRRLLSHLRHQQSELQNLLERYHPRQLIGIVITRLQEQRSRLEQLNPLQKAHRYLPLNEYGLEVDDLFRRLELTMKNSLQGLRARLERAQALVDSMNPRAVLSRGYGIVEGPAGIVSSKKGWDQLPGGASVTVAFHDGIGLAQKSEKDRA
jgi:exodeoxyribonuclease VII large subunit